LHLQVAKDKENRKLFLFYSLKHMLEMIIYTRVCRCQHRISTAMCGIINDSLIVVTMLLPLLFCMFEVAL